MTPFLAWPDAPSILLPIFKAISIVVTLGYFGYLFWRLRSWRCEFALCKTGTGRVSIYADNGHGNLRSVTFRLTENVWVTPLVSVFCIELTETELPKRQVLCVWADMLDDTNYRHLCRLLLNVNLASRVHKLPK